MLTDDAFFQPDWAGAYWGRWAGMRAVDRRVGDRTAAWRVCMFWIVGSGIGLLLGWSVGSGYDTAGLHSLDAALLCKDEKESKGRRGLCP